MEFSVDDNFKKYLWNHPPEGKRKEQMWEENNSSCDTGPATAPANTKDDVKS